MLRRITKSALPLLFRSSKQISFACFRPTYAFTTKNQPTVSLSNLLQDEITHEEANKEDLTEFTNFFENQGWKIKYDHVQVQLSKKSGPYNLRILFNAKTPMAIDEQQGQENQEQQPDQDFTEVTAYINKEGSSKWLALDFLVTTNSQAQLGTAAFIPDYETEKADKKKGRISAINYTGPELSSLDEKLQQSIYEFVESVGISGQVLQRVSQFSVSYEHQFYLQWLKDLKSLA